MLLDIWILCNEISGRNFDSSMNGYTPTWTSILSVYLDISVIYNEISGSSSASSMNAYAPTRTLIFSVRQFLRICLSS